MTDVKDYDEKSAAVVDRDDGIPGHIAPVGGGIRPQQRRLHDPEVYFEEYQYYAKLTREAEEVAVKLAPPASLLSTIFPAAKRRGVTDSTARTGSVDMTEAIDPTKTVAGTLNLSKREDRSTISDQEWVNASRAVRTATAAGCFYLITTDILGPLGLPYAFATTGFGPGITLFTIFALFAGYGGYLLWDMFIHLDSYQFPLRSYGDIGYRVYGQWARIPINILQSLQLFASVGIIIVSNGQALSVASKFKFCYVGCLAVLVLLGYGLGQIRTLQKFGWLATVAVGINVFLMIFTMAVAAHSKPFYTGAQFLSAGASLGGESVTAVNGVYPPVKLQGGLPVAPTFVGTVNGIMQAVYAYGGAQVFVEFMSELSRPRDFLKAMWGAQFFIWFVYMLYGLFMYGYQGQYSINPSPQSLSPYYAQVIANVAFICSATIAACLYGNIGVKVLYQNVFVELFRCPPLETKNGKLLWIAIIPIYWSVAFVFGAAIPNFNGLVGLISALCIIQFTYSFPPILHIAYLTQLDAQMEGEGFDPATGLVARHNYGMSRYIRGYMSGSLLHRFLKLWNIIYALASLVLAALGMYASIELIILAFQNSSQTAFTCHSPLNDAFLNGQ